jgi:alpha-tubulin suppressor-like RCC1 family protein
MWPDRPDDPSNAKYAPPATLERATAVSAGSAHACSIVAARLFRPPTLVCWGYNGWGQATVPPALGPVKAVSAGYITTCVLTPAGGVVCFGANNYGMLAVPPGLEAGITAVSAGNSHACALTADGAPICWGGNFAGQATPPPGLTGLKQIEAGTSYTAAVDAAGNVVIWGDNRDGRLTPPPGIQGAVDKVSASNFDQSNMCVVTKTGGVWCSTLALSPPADLGVATSVAVGHEYACATLAAEGPAVNVRCWGNGVGQAEVPAGLSGVAQVAAGYSVAYALKA